MCLSVLSCLVLNWECRLVNDRMMCGAATFEDTCISPEVFNALRDDGSH